MALFTTLHGYMLGRSFRVMPAILLHTLNTHQPIPVFFKETDPSWQIKEKKIQFNKTQMKHLKEIVVRHLCKCIHRWSTECHIFKFIQILQWILKISDWFSSALSPHKHLLILAFILQISSPFNH